MNKAWNDFKDFIRDCLQLSVMWFGKPNPKYEFVKQPRRLQICVNGMLFWVLMEYLVEDGIGRIYVHYVDGHRIIATRTINCNLLALANCMKENPFCDRSDDYREMNKFPWEIR